MIDTRTWRIHIAVAAIWIVIALVIGLQVAVLGAERTSLGRKLGVESDACRSMESDRQKLNAELEWKASPPALTAAVRQLGLRIGPPDAVIPPADADGVSVLADVPPPVAASTKRSAIVVSNRTKPIVSAATARRRLVQ